MKLTNLDRRTKVEKLIDEEIIKLLESADSHADIIEIMDLYERRQKAAKKPTVSSDTIAMIAGNLLGIGLIMGFERAHVISTKALGFVLKGRV